MTAHFLTSIRLFKKHLSRLITIAAIVMVSVGFMAGLGEVENHVKAAVNDLYHSHNVSDLYVKSASMTGFSDEQLDHFKKEFGEDNIKESFSYEMEINDRITRIYLFDLSDNDISCLDLNEGRMPEKSGEILVERKTNVFESYHVGDVIHIEMKMFTLNLSADLTVCGIVTNPMLLYKNEEISYQYKDEKGEYKSIQDAIYLDMSDISVLTGLNVRLVNDVYITIDDARDKFNCYQSTYKDYIEEIKKETEEYLYDQNKGTQQDAVLTLYENMGLFSLNSYAEKVGLVGIIFIVFFMAVALLVIHSAMSRLFEEERQQIACLKTLGYDDLQTISKYLLFNFVSTGIGGALAFFVSQLLTRIIYQAFNLTYNMPVYPITGGAYFYLGSLAIMMISTMLLTYLTGINTVRQRPVLLLTRKAPHAGRKVLVEKIPFIWSHLSFKHKSTMRNVFLFRSRFFMTVISVIGATVLVFAGMGLMDNSVSIPGGSSLVTISIVLIVFSALLCALVIYNITNINVSERCREIATLMVLGYSDEEVTGYIFREIYVMCAIGAILGIPFGAAFLEFAFSFVGFGNLAGVNWWTWLCTPIITMIFCVIATRLLKRKITSTDMNASLKTLE